MNLVIGAPGSEGRGASRTRTGWSRCFSEAMLAGSTSPEVEDEALISDLRDVSDLVAAN
jgi:hypothetical protein